MKILLTGGAGFIGSHLCEAFLNAGHEVTVVDNLSRGKRENVPAKATFIPLDIRDEALGEVIHGGGFDLVSHHAAQSNLRASLANPYEDMSVNLAASVALLEYCRCAGVPRFIFASSGGAIYGEQEIFPTPENCPKRPIAPYGAAKLGVEHYVRLYHELYGLQAVSMRYANVYGARQDPAGEAGVVAIFIHRFLAGEQVVIYGDGSQIRDYVYVGDVVAANLAVLNLDGYHALNISTAVGTSVMQLYDRLARLTRINVKPQFADRSAVDLQRSIIDPSLAAEVLTWRPKVGLDDGLRLTLAYFRSIGSGSG